MNGTKFCPAGERVLVTKGGVTEITEGVYADFTTTFKSERAVMKELPSFNVTQVRTAWKSNLAHTE